VAADQFADLAGRVGAGFDRRPHAAHVALDDRGDQAAADPTRLTISTLAALAIASVASTRPINPLVSTNPIALCMVHIPQ
jgi:hypothetical protein